jgi:hypothetical protein
MKKLLVALTLLAAAGFAAAQSTTVSSTGVVDTDGFTWAGGTYSIQFSPAPNFPNPSSYGWTGGTLVTSYTGSLDSNGAFSVSIPDSTKISPSNSQWFFMICPVAPTGCFTLLTPVSGTTENLTTALNAVAQGPRFTAGSTNYGYGTVELSSGKLPGTMFYNVTNSTCNQWSGSAWVSCVSGTVALPASQKNLAVPAVYTGTTTATNQDNRGKLTLVAGTKSYTFTQGNGTAGIWTTAPVCQVQDQTFANQATTVLTVSTSTLTIANAVGTTDTYTYLCWPGN